MVIFRSIAFLCLLVLAAPAFAHDAPARAAKAEQAVQALQKYHDGVRRAGRRPDYTVAPAAGLLRELYDVESLATLPPPAAKDIDWLLAWSAAANHANRQVMLFGMQADGGVDEQLMKRNLDDYEDQVTAAMNAVIRLNARALDAMAVFLSGLPKAQVTPVRLEGLQMARAGGGEVLQGVLISAAHAAKPANARILIAAINDTRETWVNAILPDDRPKIVALLKQLPRQVSDRDVTGTADALLVAFTEKQ